MLSSLSSNAITAKARAIYGKRLTGADYRELLRQRTVSDVATYLKTNTSYSQRLAGINELEVHRGQLEELLHQDAQQKFIRLTHYDFSPRKGFYRYTILDVEINVILRVIMLLNSGTPQDIILGVPTFMKEFLSFDLIRLSKVEDFDGLLAALAGTPYPAVLKRFAEENGQINLALCEYELRCFYYQTIFSLIDHFYRGKTKRELRRIVLIEIEILNMSMIYRLKTFFHYSPERIKSMLIPFFYRITPSTIDSLLEPMSDAEFADRMRLGSYATQMKDVSFNYDISFSYMEGYTHHLLYLVSRKLMRLSTSAPVAFYSLRTLTRIEIENLTTIIEGIRYQNAPSEIEKLLILE